MEGGNYVFKRHWDQIDHFQLLMPNFFFIDDPYLSSGEQSVHFKYLFIRLFLFISLHSKAYYFYYTS